jgi:hypothetical protein
VEYLVTMTMHLPEGTPGIADSAIRPASAPLGGNTRGLAPPAAGFHDPGRVFSFFAIAAGMDVLLIRLTAAGHPLATGILAGVAAAAFVARILRERVSWW